MRTHRIATLNLDSARLAADLGVTKQFRFSDAYSEFICGEWRSCMLFNKSGGVDDTFLEDYDLPARMTLYGSQMPYLSDVLRRTFKLEHLRFARLAKLTPGSVMVPHRDYLELEHDLVRLHIPLATDNHCFSAEEDTVYQMKQGELWFIDASRIHTAACFSTKPRTHLILDFTEVDSIDTVLVDPTNSPQIIPAENVVSLKPFKGGTKEALLGMAGAIDTVNYKDVLAILIKKYFTTSLDVAAIFDGLSEIARLSNDPTVMAKVEWHFKHCLIER